MIPPPILTTKRLRLRPFSEADIERVAELANDPELSRNLRSFEFPYLVEDAEKWVSSLPDEWQTGKSVVFAVCLRDKQEALIGATGVVLEQQSNRGELGYWIGRNCWGKGIATEACRSVLDFSFNQLGLNKVVAECLTRNPASAAVLEKLGMVQEGLLAKHFRKDETQEYCDVRVFGLLRSAWNGRGMGETAGDCHEMLPETHKSPKKPGK